MRARPHIFSSVGFSLLELLVTMAVLGVCGTVGIVAIDGAISTREARGAAQSYQSAAAWAQIDVLWHSGSVAVDYRTGLLSVAHEYGLCGGDIGRAAPDVEATANLARWRRDEGVAVEFTGELAAPDGGGSLYFQARQGAYRIAVRPESGLTVRSLVETAP